MSTLHRIPGCDVAARKADVVFLHGLGGDPFGTWRYGKEDSTSWPHWLAEEFRDVAVWSLEYAASPTRWPRSLGPFSRRPRDEGQAMSLPDRGLHALDLMVQHGIGHRPILWIGHSLGGLLLKQVLRTSKDSTRSKEPSLFRETRAVLFLATPHDGASLASLVNAFRRIFRSTVSIEDLRAHDPHLRNLKNWYRNHSGDSRVETRTYFETLDVFSALDVFRWFGVRIVDEGSSSPEIGADPVGLDEDHLSISKPRARDAQVCVAARELLRDYVLATPTHRQSAEPTPASVTPPPEIVVKLDPALLARPDQRIPRELPPAAERFFGREAQLGELTARLRGAKNSAVVGAAGIGKTALAAEAVTAVVGTTRESLAASPFHGGVVFLDLYRFHGQAELAWNSLANSLAGVGFLETKPARDRATEACRGRSVLVIIEGGEEADGRVGRLPVADLLSVLSPENRWLLLTRDRTQAAAIEMVELKDALSPENAANLFDALTGQQVTGALRDQVLTLLEGHPLALTWAGSLLALGNEDPARLAADWKSRTLPKLGDPHHAERTLEWLFDRSTRGLDGTAAMALTAAGLLARAPFRLNAIEAAVGHVAGDAARDALKQLVQRSLLRRFESADDHWEFTHVLGYRFARKEPGPDATLLKSLAAWMDRDIRTTLAVRGSDGALGLLARAIQHATALLQVDRSGTLMPLANFLLYEARERLVSLGRLDLVAAALGAVSGWLDQLPPEMAAESTWRRERAACLSLRGDLAVAQGNLPEAQRLFGESLTLRKRLAAADPDNAAWQRDLSVSLNKLGDLAVAQGNLPEAQRLFGESLTLRKRLAAADPDNAAWQRDLSVSLNKLGDLAVAQGNLPEAQRLFGESLTLRKRLAAADPDNAAWQRDLSVSLNKLGDLAVAQGNLPEAQRLFGESLTIRKRLAAADPDNAAWQRDLSVSLNKLGDLAVAQGNLPEAQRLFGESLTISKRLAAADPDNAAWQRDLSYSLTVMGQLFMKLQQWAEALPLLEESLVVDEGLAVRDPSNATWQNDVRVSRRLVEEVRSKTK